GFDFNGKMHFLKCFDCGCFELPVDAQKPAPLKTWICREDGTPAGEGREFIILDIKRREYLLKNGRWRSRRTYLYICGVCGAQQKVCHVDEYGFAGQEGPADSGERP
ncbi:MAG: hypothetical protein HGA80_06355, partial [Candidatus Omnitrophica bacterium]|nr:hypothetical protein [Candidatus Omnitrophota bacterium]